MGGTCADVSSAGRRRDGMCIGTDFPLRRETVFRMKVLDEYPTHHYWREYLKCDLFCPSCGKKDVWEEQSEGDYYCGPDFICVACGAKFTIQGPAICSPSNETKVLEQLRSGVTLKPTTPKGG